jgi:hypothetical protein
MQIGDDFGMRFLSAYMPMFNEIALGMLDCRESEEAFRKIYEIEVFEPEYFLAQAEKSNFSTYRSLRRHLGENNDMSMIIAYHLGRVGERMAVQRAKDYAQKMTVLPTAPPTTLFELGVIKSKYSSGIRDRAGEISMAYSARGMGVEEIVLLTTVVPPDVPSRRGTGIADILKASDYL